MGKLFKCLCVAIMSIALLITISMKISAHTNIDNDHKNGREYLNRNDYDYDRMTHYMNKNDDLTQHQSENIAVGMVDGIGSYGSGVLVAPNKVLTATHVVSDDKGHTAKSKDVQYFPYGRNSDVLQEQTYPIKIKKIEPVDKTELTILTLEKPIKNVRPLKIAKHNPERYDNVKAIGYYAPDSESLSQQYTSNGKALYTRSDLDGKNQRVIGAHIYNHKGMSGGPLLNDKNEIIGLTSFFYVNDNNRSNDTRNDGERTGFVSTDRLYNKFK